MSSPRRSWIRNVAVLIITLGDTDRCSLGRLSVAMDRPEIPLLFQSLRVKRHLSRGEFSSSYRFFQGYVTSTYDPMHRLHSPPLNSARGKMEECDDRQDKRPAILRNGKSSSKSPPISGRLAGEKNMRATFLLALWIAIIVLFPLPSAFRLSSSSIAATSPSVSTFPNTVNKPNTYWYIQNYGNKQERVASNIALMDYIVGTINTMYYDVTGGIRFDPRTFYHTYQEYKLNAPLATREGVLSSIHWLMQDLLQDPYSTYLTREELRAELQSSSASAAPMEWPSKLGIVVKPPTADVNRFLFGPSFPMTPQQSLSLLRTTSLVPASSVHYSNRNAMFHKLENTKQGLLSPLQGYQLPVIVAVLPNSLGERLGLVVGDRILSYQDEKSRGYNQQENEFLTVAKPVYTAPPSKSSIDFDDEVPSSLSSAYPLLNVEVNLLYNFRDNLGTRIDGYRPTRVRIPKFPPDEGYLSQGYRVEDEKVTPSSFQQEKYVSSNRLSGGNAYVQYRLLTPQNSIFQKSLWPTQQNRNHFHDLNSNGVGYIRLTRFSRASTQGFIDAVKVLEKWGTQQYIIDVRNNYGGVIQEAMLLASSLLRDPHMVLCYTLNSRGGLTPHDVEEYVMDKRYLGYLLSSESSQTTLRQVRREHPAWFQPNRKEEWLPMSSFASLHEQRVKRGIHGPGSLQSMSSTTHDRGLISLETLAQLQQLAAQKDIVILVNEGTASSAEVFASALHDNGRSVAVVGTKTYGKGLVQHTFPTPDGGGLRLTVVEYLTPALHHVTHVGGAQFDRVSGEYIGGGIQPDIFCDSRDGVPENVGSDLCIGVAMDALHEAESAYRTSGQLSVKRIGGVDDGSKARRAVTMGIVKVSRLIEL
jgi:Peptidase family S41